MVFILLATCDELTLHVPNNFSLSKLRYIYRCQVITRNKCESPYHLVIITSSPYGSFLSVKPAVAQWLLVLCRFLMEHIQDIIYLRVIICMVSELCTYFRLNYIYKLMKWTLGEVCKVVEPRLLSS
jgi:hypothetical protein